MTWIVWHAPDGSETVLVDTAFNGQPQSSSVNTCGQLSTYQPANRGKVFRSYDGSYLTFVAAQDVPDGSGPVTGTLYFRDGAAYRIGADSYVSQIEDRNGNQLTYSFQPNATGGVYTVHDSAGRTEAITITEDPASNPQDTIVYTGTGGVARTITVNYALLQNALSVGEQVTTYACLFPELNGSSSSTFNPWIVSSIVLADGHSYNFRYNAYGELTQLTLPAGGAYQYKYPEVTGCAGSGSGVVPVNQDSGYRIYRRVLERDELADGVTISAKTIFTPLANPAPDPNHPSRGVTTVEADFEDATGALLRRELHFFYGDPSSPNSIPQVDTNYPAWLEGIEFETKVQTGSSVTLQDVATAWQQRPCGAGENCWYPDPQADGAPPHDPQMCQANTTLDSGPSAGIVMGDDQYNNQTDRFEFDYAFAPPVSTACPALASLTNYARHTATAYQTGSSYTASTVNLVGLPSSRTVFRTDGSQVAQESWLYDQAALQNAAGTTGHDDTNYGAGNAIRGNITSHQVWQNTTGTFPGESFTYDTTGRIVGYTDFKGNAETFTYGDFAHVYPTAVVNALGAAVGTRTYAYDQASLKRTSDTDENGVTTNYSYADVMDRLTRIARGSGTALESWTSWSYPTPAQVLVTQDQNARNDGALRVDTLFDGLGRPKETDQYEGASQYIATTASYDALGRIHAATNPSRPGDNLNYATTYSFDALGRTTAVQTADGATANIGYSGSQTTATDAAGATRISVADGLGRMQQATEVYQGVNYTTVYDYDALDNLLTVTQGGQVRRFGYDSRGRLTSAANPENGAMSYAYDGNGNVIWRSDNRGVETCDSYDAANRPTLQVYYTGSVPAGNAGQCAAIPAANYYASTPNVSYTY
ncbi:MAG: hypothetical protein ABI165_14050, partial [Bryobacteraceae bacterium]